jgi:hypothetical protein
MEQLLRSDAQTRAHRHQSRLSDRRDSTSLLGGDPPRATLCHDWRLARERWRGTYTRDFCATSLLRSSSRDPRAT